jgi:hypothetical protein
MWGMYECDRESPIITRPCSTRGCYAKGMYTHSVQYSRGENEIFTGELRTELLSYLISAVREGLMSLQ